MAGGGKLILRLFLSFAAVICVSLIAAGAYAFHSVRLHFIEQIRNELHAAAVMVGDEAAESLGARSEAEINAWCGRVGRLSAIRITLILPDGRVVCDSEEDPRRMENHADRAEIIEATAEGEGTAVRFSYTRRMDMLYLARAARVDGRLVAVVRTAKPMTAITHDLDTVYLEIGLAGLIIALLSAAVSLWIARWINRPIGRIRRGAEIIASGDLAFRLSENEPTDYEEAAALASSMNRMAAQLQARFDTINEQRGELEAVLSNMVEAVMTVDGEERIVRINRSAAVLFGVDPENSVGRRVVEITRNPDLLAFVARVLRDGDTREGEAVLHGDGERFLQVQGVRIPGAQGAVGGALIVLHDVTRLKRLERVRRDFVANVSHELKTPLTAVKGFVETLKAGALAEPENAGRFLDIIEKQTDRLAAIVDDLLSLSSLEQGEEKRRPPMSAGGIAELLRSAAAIGGGRAGDKNVEIEIDCLENLVCVMNAELLEQAVINLVDNAVKYGDAGSKVRVEALEAGSEVLIHVRDQGCGIPAQDLDRIFERFYRVDKARSRRLGGTGLGLAIVKHIMLVHGGRVEVKSEPGRGSVFTLRLPRP